MACTDPQHIRQHRHAKGLLDPSLLPTHLVGTQAQIRLECPLALLHGPPSLLRTHPLASRPLVQSGHQAFRRLWAQGPPSLTQDHSDVTDLSQTEACALHPAGFAALGSRETGHPSARRI
jgi:hypothetical protein